MACEVPKLRRRILWKSENQLSRMCHQRLYLILLTDYHAQAGLKDGGLRNYGDASLLI